MVPKRTGPQTCRETVGGTKVLINQMIDYLEGGILPLEALKEGYLL